MPEKMGTCQYGRQYKRLTKDSYEMLKPAICKRKALPDSKYCICHEKRDNKNINCACSGITLVETSASSTATLEAEYARYLCPSPKKFRKGINLTDINKKCRDAATKINREIFGKAERFDE